MTVNRIGRNRVERTRQIAEKIEDLVEDIIEDIEDFIDGIIGSRENNAEHTIVENESQYARDWSRAVGAINSLDRDDTNVIPEIPDNVPYGERGLYGGNSGSDSSESESSNSNSNADPYGLGGYEHGVGDNDPGDGDESGGEDPIGWDGNAEGYDNPGDLDGGSPDGGGGDDPGGGDPGSGFGGKPIVLDLDGDGAIADHDELSFVGYVEGAQTDLEGLSHFDTNGNGELDPGDADWSKFRVWQDLNRDGESDPGELRTLTEAGISSIPLTGDGVERRAIAT